MCIPHSDLFFTMFMSLLLFYLLTIFFKQHLDSKNKDTKNKQLPELPLPNIKAQATRCLTYFKNPVLPQTPSTNSPSVSKRTRTVHAGSYTFQKSYSRVYIEKWTELEKRVVKYATGDLPYPFKPFVPCLSSGTQNRETSVIACKGRSSSGYLEYLQII